MAVEFQRRHLVRLGAIREHEAPHHGSSAIERLEELPAVHSYLLLLWQICDELLVYVFVWVLPPMSWIIHFDLSRPRLVIPFAGALVAQIHGLDGHGRRGTATELVHGTVVAAHGHDAVGSAEGG